MVWQILTEQPLFEHPDPQKGRASGLGNQDF